MLQMPLQKITLIFGIFFLFILLQFHPSNGQPFADEYKEPIAKLKAFIETIVEPLADAICKRKDDKNNYTLRQFREKLCDIVRLLEQQYDYMVEELSLQKDFYVPFTFGKIKDAVSTHSYSMDKRGEFPEMLREMFRKALKLKIKKGLPEYLKMGGWKVRDSEIGHYYFQFAHPAMPEDQNLAKQQFQKAVDELKALQLQGDYSSDQAKQSAYECACIGREMARRFIEKQDRIGELQWALQQFPVDLLVYKMEIPELRDIRIEWDEQDGTASGLVPEGYEWSMLLLDHFSETLLKPFSIKFGSRRWLESEREDPEYQLYYASSTLMYYVKHFNDDRVKFEKKLLKQRKRQEKGKEEDMGKQQMEIDVVLDEYVAADANSANKFKLIPLIAKVFQKIKNSVSSHQADFFMTSQTQFHLSEEFCYQTGTFEAGYAVEGFKEMRKNRFKNNLKKLMGKHFEGDFASKEVRELAYECMYSCRKLEESFESPVEQLNWALQQFTVNLMAFSMEIGWVRELPVQNMNVLIEYTRTCQLLEKMSGHPNGQVNDLDQKLCRNVLEMLKDAEKAKKEPHQTKIMIENIYAMINHTKGIKLLYKFIGEILMKLKEKCHEIGQKETKSLIEINLCNSVFKMLDVVEEFETALKWPHADITESLIKIKFHTDIFIHDITRLCSHLGGQIPVESEKIREEVDKIRNELGTNSAGLKQRFEAKLKELLELQGKGDFSSVHAKQVAFDCVYTGHWMVFGREWEGNSKRENPFDELASAFRQFAVDLLVYRMEIEEIRAIPDILLWTHGMD